MADEDVYSLDDPVSSSDPDLHRARAPSHAVSEPDISYDSSLQDTSPLIHPRTQSVDSQLHRLSRTTMPGILVGHQRGAERNVKDRCLHASVYVQEGEDNDKFQTHPKEKRSMMAYLLIHNHIAWSLELTSATVLLLITAIEYPSVFLEGDLFNASSTVDTHYRDSYYLPFHTVTEITCLTVLSGLLLLRAKWMGIRRFFQHYRSVFKLLLLICMYVEVIIILIRFRNHIRVTRCLRPVFLLDSYYCSGVRRMTRQILQSLPPILDMIVLLLAFILVFALFGYFLFIDVEHSVFFVDLLTSFVSLFILLTTANYPTVMMPVYSEYWWAPVFFIVFLCIGLYLIMNLLLAVVYSTFSTFDKEKYRKLYLHKREALCRAYDVICGTSPMTFDQFRHLMTLNRPRWDHIKILCCFKALDSSCSGSLSLQEFLRFYEVRDMTWAQYNELEGDEVRWYNRIKRNRIRKIFRRVNILVRHKIFKYFIDFSLLCFGVFLIFVAVEAGNKANSGNEIEPKNETGNKTESSDKLDSNFKECKFLAEKNYVYWINVGFLILYSVEALLKLIGLGPRAYFARPWNIFDFLCVVLSATGMTVDLIYYKSQNVDTVCRHGREARDWLRYIIYVRIVRLFRLFQIKQRYRDVLGTLFVIMPRMLNVGLFIMLLYYFFAIIGMEAFAFMVGPGPGCCKHYEHPAFDVSQYYNGETSTSDTYYLNNFNNILRSYVLLFELMIVNNWYIAMNGFTSASGTQWTRVYFMIFFLVSVIIVAIVISFILDAFLFRIESKEKARGQVFGEGFDTIEVRISVDEYREIGSKKPSQIIGNIQGGMLRYRGKRMKTKEDFRLQMYADEVKEWVEKQDEELNKERNIAKMAGQLTTLTHDRLLADGPNLVENHFSAGGDDSMRSDDTVQLD